MIAYICEQGAKIHREGERLIVRGKGEPRTIFTHKPAQLLLFGNIHLTAQARNLILAKKIDTVFLSSSGKYRGRIVADESENVFLRKRQYSLLDDQEFQLGIAREIVIAKLHNQTVMLARLKREHDISEVERGIGEIKAIGNEAGNARNVDSLRGLEGAAANIYFHYFSRAFREELGFTKRVRRPPTDPVNAILSLIYTLLVDRCLIACRLAGLDPFPGNLHALEYGRHSLPLELVEEFRVMPGDALTLSLFNLHIIKPDDFEIEAVEKNDNVQNGLKLKSDALKKLLEAFAKRMETEFKHPHAGHVLTYANAINWQAKEYRDVVEGKAHKYRPIIWH